MDTFTAEHLADIYGTEKDKVNCPFYWKIGACRHGDKCSRLHNKPTVSQTLLIANMYPNPISMPFFDAQGNQVEYSADFLKQHFDDFYEDVFDEASKHGKVDHLHVCDNVCEHLLGNVYIKFAKEDDAKNAVEKMNNRYYAGRMMKPELSPVTDFKEARCRQFEVQECNRGGLCNFMHLRKPSRELDRQLFGEKRGNYYNQPYERERASLANSSSNKYENNSSNKYDSKPSYDRKRRSRSRSPGRRSNNYGNNSSNPAGGYKKEGGYKPYERHDSYKRERSPKEYNYRKSHSSYNNNQQ